MKIKTITVVGANGTMGANVSAIFASFGNATVYMVSRDKEKSKKAAIKAGKSVKADSIVSRLFPVDYSSLDECVKASDLVFESAAENLELKIELHTKIGQSLKKGAVACTGSSGLSITRLAECYPEELRGQFFGVHMFNPPYQLTLCELTASPYSDMQMYAELKEYLTSTLFRTVAESKDLPAFLGNRIGFYVMNEALQYAERYQDNGGIDYIDSLLGPFTGRTKPPITTADFVGLDVHKAIVDNIYENTNDYVHEKFVLPGYVQKLIDQKKLGRKTGEGLYKLIKNDSGDKRMMVYDIKLGIY
jgi:3-hydroxyacyl-CoA dehydrogenase